MTSITVLILEFGIIAKSKQVNNKGKIMGYEIKLIIGCKGSAGKKIERGNIGEIDCGLLHYPLLRNEDGSFKYTDIVETYFMIYAEIDLCKLGRDSHIGKILTENKSDKEEFYYFGSDGNTKITEDIYGSKPNEISVAKCIEALRLDVKDSDYRRFKWALALLESMKDENEISVIWYGH